MLSWMLMRDNYGGGGAECGYGGIVAYLLLP